MFHTILQLNIPVIYEKRLILLVLLFSLLRSSRIRAQADLYHFKALQAAHSVITNVILIHLFVSKYP